MKIGYLLFLPLGSLLLASHSYAQQNEPGETILDTGRGTPIPLQRLEQNTADINIDGKINESAWAGINVINNMRVINPDTLEA
ncbi:MAG: hypothetical protein JKY98_05920, partial [Gammaproteobacteria bacterium]|nr:hypothetical protein [Gammaproteobacteria bacterium]